MRKQIVMAFLFGLVLPMALMAVMIYNTRPEPQAVPQQTQEPTVQTVRQQTVTVLNMDGEVEEMTMHDYLTRVVLAEMPADFHEEALKAQAVAARTFTMKRLESGSKHDGAVCTQSSCCQGYRTPESYLADGGQQASVDKVSQAVADTAGEVLTYDGELIDATYFSCSGGSTEAAVAVWGSDVPYLQAVESPGEEDAAHYTDTVTFSPAQFAQKTGCAGKGQPEDWFGAMTYTDGGGVDTMVICGKEYEGTELRQLLGLRSTVFEVEVRDGEILIKTRGYGHRVGMSQYGAEAMAQDGSGYREILAHYYQGTEVEMMG